MSGNGQHLSPSSASSALHWSGRVLAAEDVRTRLNGHRELVTSPRTIITALAADDLKARGIRVVRREEPKTETPKPRVAWGYAQERPNGFVQSAVQALRRDGVALKELAGGESLPCRWARAAAECIACGECVGGVLFCEDPGLVCCVSNKVAGVRAVPVTTVAQAARATLTLGANFVAVEMPGRTYFELRQILRIMCMTTAAACPDGVACTLKELDGHAHR